MSASLSALLPVNVAALTEQQLTCLLATPPAQLLIDCGALLLPHPLGVCAFVAQLLPLRHKGTSIGLCNVHPQVRHCLQELHLSAIFHLNGNFPSAEACLTGRAAGHSTLT